LKNVTPIDSVHGYQPSLYNSKWKNTFSDGGGVCQTSTTMFRAALNAGLEILERYPHAYRVSYYEQNYDVGIDASVFEPSADFRFKNDTSAYILVQTSVDKENYYVKYELYGTSDGRKATVGKATIWSQTPPLPSIYQDDPTLPVGTTKQVDWEAWGRKFLLTGKWKETEKLFMKILLVKL
jgi:vancomycin resistance protein YoaR